MSCLELVELKTSLEGSIYQHDLGECFYMAQMIMSLENCTLYSLESLFETH